MSVLFAFLSILCFHYAADYVFQSRWMGDKKSTQWIALFAHTGMYTCVMLFTAFPFIYLGVKGYVWFWWLLFNGVTHGLTDMITSISAKIFWESGHKYATFNVMGADQLIHQLTLGLSLLFAIWYSAAAPG